MQIRWHQYRVKIRPWQDFWFQLNSSLCHTNTSNNNNNYKCQRGKNVWRHWRMTKAARNWGIRIWKEGKGISHEAVAYSLAVLGRRTEQKAQSSGSELLTPSWNWETKDSGTHTVKGLCLPVKIPGKLYPKKSGGGELKRAVLTKSEMQPWITSVPIWIKEIDPYFSSFQKEGSPS